MGEDFMKLSLVNISLGYQFYILMMGVSGLTIGRGGGNASDDDAIKAFLIIAFLGYTALWILSVLINFGELRGNKIAVIVSLILAFGAVICIIIGISIFAANVNNNNNAYTYIYTCYSLAIILGFIGGIFMLLPMCGISG